MNKKISYLTIEKLKNFIWSKANETMENFLEDLKALSSKDFINSIKEAREDYKSGDIINYNQIF